MLLTLAVILNIVTAFLAHRRTKTWLNPFTAIMAMFALNGLFYVFSPLVESANETSEPVRATEVYVLLFSLGFLGLTLLLRPEAFNLRSVMTTRVAGLTLILLLCFGLVVAGTVMLIVQNNGTLPIVLMSRGFAVGKGSSYEDFLVPFVTPFTMGVSRFMFIALCLDFLSKEVTLVRHVRDNLFNYGLAAGAAVLVLGTGLRNVLFWPIAFFLFGFIRKRGFRLGHALISGALMVFFGLFFVVLGNYRFGTTQIGDSPLSGLVATEVGNPILQNMFNWLALYAGTSYPNLNAMIMMPPDPQFGLITLTEILPDGLIEAFVRIPQNSILYLTTGGLLPYRGFTFRTLFTDFYADFGYAGSLAAGLLLYAFAVRCYNRSGVNPGWLFHYLCFLPALLMFPFLNLFTGLPTLVPILFYYVFIGFRPVTRISLNPALPVTRAAAAT